jgi:predicted DNA-binding transcriptional regulator YafY
MKSARLLSALLLLQAHGRMAERELAERLEISQRTAHRDMEALCAAGIPLIAHRGAQGGWELEKGWRTRVPGLDEAELQGLLMAQPSALGDRRLAAAAASAFDKLLAALSPAMRAQAEWMRERLHIDPSGWRPSMEDLSALPVVQDALARDGKLSFVYVRADGAASERTVDPLGLVSKQATWYLVARNAAGLRTYRVSRMRQAVALAVRFERPSGFNLAGWWRRSTEALREKEQSCKATLALTAKGEAALKEWAVMKPVANPDPDRRRLPSEWQLFEIEFDSPYAARFVALGLGSRAQVVGPEELRRDVDAEVRRMSATRQTRSGRVVGQ